MPVSVKTKEKPMKRGNSSSAMVHARKTILPCMYIVLQKEHFDNCRFNASFVGQHSSSGGSYGD